MFRGPLNRTFKGTRVAWCPDLGGLPLDPRVRATLAAQRNTFEALGCIDGVKMEHYVAWMKSAYWITATFRPAISVPAGFTNDGLPVGVQIVGRHHADFSVFQLAYAFEQETRIGQRRPPVA